MYEVCLLNFTGIFAIPFPSFVKIMNSYISHWFSPNLPTIFLFSASPSLLEFFSLTASSTPRIITSPYHAVFFSQWKDEWLTGPKQTLAFDGQLT